MENNRGRKFGHPVSAETRAKISAKLKGRKMPEEQRLRMVGKPPSAALAASRGKPLSAEHRAKIGAALKTQTGPCSVEDCDRGAKIRGWCNRHYRIWRRHGDPEAPDQRVVKSGPKATNWKGDDASTSAVHFRAQKMLPRVCALADETCKGRLEASFRRHDTPQEFWIAAPTGPYSTNLDHYWRLCRSHHVRYDHGKLNL